MKAPEPQEIFFTIKKDGSLWEVDGQLETKSMKDVLDLIMILMTNAVRLGLSITDITKTMKPMEKAMTGQLKDIIKAEVKEARDGKERTESSQQENAEDNKR